MFDLVGSMHKIEALGFDFLYWLDIVSIFYNLLSRVDYLKNGFPDQIGRPESNQACSEQYADRICSL